MQTYTKLTDNEQECTVLDWGHVSYNTAWQRQTSIAQQLIEAKRNTSGEQILLPHKLILCEHNPVYTLGKSGSAANVLLSEPELNQKGIEFYRINRGGDITYHGPGQLVCYPIFDLERMFRDVRRYVHCLEEVVIRCLSDYGIEAFRLPQYTGVWLRATPVFPERKICAIGVHMSRWVSMHGFAFNINTDLSYFRHIIPCGIQDDNKAVSSLAIELGREVEMNEVKKSILFYFSKVFGLKYAIEPEKHHV